MALTVLLPEETPQWLSEGCRGKDGARRLRRAVQDRVEAPLAAFLLQCPKKPVRIRGRMTGALFSGKLIGPRDRPE